MQQILSSLNLNDIKIFLGDGPSTTDEGRVKIHPTKVCIGLHTLIEIVLILMAVHYQTNFRSLLLSEMDIVYTLSTKSKVLDIK